MQFPKRTERKSKEKKLREKKEILDGSEQRKGRGGRRRRKTKEKRAGRKRHKSAQIRAYLGFRKELEK
jgi:hypothetical protein